MRDDRGSGSILAVAVIAAVLAVASLLVPVSLALSAKRQAANAADAAALAAADTAVGILPGAPCDAAASLATANGATIGGCSVEELVVTVRVSVPVFGLTATASATAGPAGSGVK